MTFGQAGIVFAMVTGGASLLLHLFKFVADERANRRAAKLWVKLARIGVQAVKDDPRSDALLIQTIDIDVAYKGGGEPLTVYGATLQFDPGGVAAGGLMESPVHIPARFGGSFAIDAKSGIVSRVRNHGRCVLVLDSGESDFRELYFHPTILPSPVNQLVYIENQREGDYFSKAADSTRVNVLKPRDK